MNKYLQKLLKNTSLMIPYCYRFSMISSDKTFALILSSQLIVFFFLILSMLLFNFNYVAIVTGGLCVCAANFVNLFMETKLPTLQNFILAAILKYSVYVLTLLIAAYLITDFWPHALIGILLAQMAYFTSCFTYARTVWQ